MNARSIAAAVCLSSAVALGACAKYTYVAPMRAGLPTSEDTTYPVTIVPVAGDKCGKDKDTVKVLYGKPKTPLTWQITNNCKVGNVEKGIRVWIQKVRPKHKEIGDGMFPFTTRPTHVDVKYGATMDIKVEVLDKPSDPKYSGLNVYTYAIRVKVDNGKDNTDDPEIIIDWP